MKLYKIAAANYATFYGTPDDLNDRSDCTTIAQTPSCDNFLFVCKDAQEAQTGLTLLSSVPSGFVFTYSQECVFKLIAAVLARTI